MNAPPAKLARVPDKIEIRCNRYVIDSVAIAATTNTRKSPLKLMAPFVPVGTCASRAQDESTAIRVIKYNSGPRPPRDNTAKWKRDETTV